MNSLWREASDRPEEEKEEKTLINKKQKAFLMGVDTYGEGFSSLQNAANDANAIAKVLAMEYDFEIVSSEPGKPLLNEGAKLGVIREIFESIIAQEEKNTRWLFYFAGHGLVIEGQGYLLPADAIRGEPNTYLSFQWLIRKLMNSFVKEALLIVDACYGGQALAHHLSDLFEGKGEQILQLISSGNPNQPVLDGGGNSHSVFTQSLLEALQGWAGVHEADGSIRFSRLLDHLVFEIPARLRNLGELTTQQRPIGGYITGNANRNEFVFQPIAPRLHPKIVQEARSDNPTDRYDSLKHLLVESEQRPEIRSLAVALATQHLHRKTNEKGRVLVTSTLPYEPVAEVRGQAAKLLGGLGDTAAVEPLIAALDDEPQVCRAAAYALGRLSDLSAIPPLLNKLPTANEKLFLDLIAAIGVLNHPSATLEALRQSVRRNLLIPFIGPDFPQALTGVLSRADIVRRMAESERLPASGFLADMANATIPDQKRYTDTCRSCGAVQDRSGNRHRFTSLMRDQFDALYGQSGPIYKNLANLKISFWISGAYDNLLTRSLNANEIFKGTDTQYQLPGRPAIIVRLVGDVSRPDSLRVLEVDYEEPLRVDRLLTLYLRDELQNKIVLFLGYDPHSPDFTLLVKHVLNRHLTDVNMRAFILWDHVGPIHQWLDQPIQPIAQDALSFVRALAQSNP